jgi:DNA polymerase-3 subunit gamma/tau
LDFGLAYEVIARKWRPQTFDEVVGQEVITRTLRNAVEQERIHHAYLFTGARGVGKTTTARILAKALNCVKGITPEPCGVCSSCTEIAAGGSLDVMEIDAASHTGVDNIRDTVINSVGISPARDRFKVFIVDEVHQLSTAAFNALLKTLEEPPSRVVFVLATTELHKVPDTITSRCQVFEFRTIGLAKIQAKLGQIARQMNVQVTPAALAAVARAGEGSMRDAQSALDQVIAFAGETIDLPDVSTALGIVGDGVLYDFLDAISQADAPTVLRLARRLVEGGHDLRNFTRGMMRAARNLLVARAVGYDPELVDATEADAPRVSELAKRFSEAEIVRIFSLLAALEQDIRQSSDPRFQLEIGLVRLAELPRLRPLDEILERLGKLEARLAGSAVSGSGSVAPPRAVGGQAEPPPARSGPAPAASSPRARSAAPPEIPEPPPFFDGEPDDADAPPFAVRPAAPVQAAPPRQPAAPPPTPRPAPPATAAPVTPEPQVGATGLDGDAAIAEVKTLLERQNKMMLLAALESAAEVTLDGARLVIRFASGKNRLRQTAERAESRGTLESIVRQVTGRTVRVSVVTSDSPVANAAPPEAREPLEPAPPAPAAPPAAPLPVVSPPAAPPPVGPALEADPIVQAVLETFRGQLIGIEKPPSDT